MTTSAGDKQSKVDNCGDLRKFIEKLKCKDTDKETSDCNLNTTKSDGDSDASQDEMIIQKRRLSILRQEASWLRRRKMFYKVLSVFLKEKCAVRRNGLRFLLNSLNVAIHWLGKHKPRSMK